jgi:Phage integrase, N-terminal SAM-like domain
MAVKLKERNGKWWLFVHWHGQRKAKLIGTKEAAEHAKILLEAKLAFGAEVIFEPVKKPNPPPAPLLFGDYFRTWLKTYAKLACKESTWKSYERDFRLYLEPAFGQTPLGDLARDDHREADPSVADAGSES